MGPRALPSDKIYPAIYLYFNLLSRSGAAGPPSASLLSFIPRRNLKVKPEEEIWSPDGGNEPGIKMGTNMRRLARAVRGRYLDARRPLDLR